MPIGADSLACLCLLARLHHISADPGTLAHQLGLAPSEPVTPFHLLRAAKHLGLKAKITRTTPDRLNLAVLPALARLVNPDGTERWATARSRPAWPSANWRRTGPKLASASA